MAKDHRQPVVAMTKPDDVLVIVCRNHYTNAMESVRFSKKYIRQLALDMLEIEDHG